MKALLLALALALALLLATGCAGSPTINVAGLPENVQNEMGAAVAEWNRAAPVGIVIEYSGKANVHVQTLGTVEHPFEPSPDGVMHIAGYTQARDSGSDIYLDPRLWTLNTPEKRKRTMLHELGHALGLHHSDTGIMAPQWNDFNCVDASAAGKLGGLGTCEN